MKAKISLTALVIFFSLSLSAQSSAKHFCREGIQCNSEIMALVPGYQIVKDTAFSKIRAFVFKNADGDQLQIFYDEKTGSPAQYSMRSIVGPRPSVEKIYTEYFGRAASSDQLKSGDKWRTPDNTFDLSAYDPHPGYIMLRIF